MPVAPLVSSLLTLPSVDVCAAAFPDMHRELDSFYFDDNVVIVELSLNGTHKGDLAMPAGTIPEGYFLSLLRCGSQSSGTARRPRESRGSFQTLTRTTAMSLSVLSRGHAMDSSTTKSVARAPANLPPQR